MTSNVITLPDGRRLNWHEFGDPDGAPVIYTAGTPRELPDATLHVSDSSEHDIGHDLSDEIMSVLASYVRHDPDIDGSSSASDAE